MRRKATQGGPRREGQVLYGGEWMSPKTAETHRVYHSRRVRLIADVTPGMRDRVRMYAIAHDLTMTAVVIQALQRFLEAASQ